MSFSTFISGARYDAQRNQFVNGANTFLYGADGPIAILDGIHRLTKTSAAAMTLAPPTADDEGNRVVLTAGTAFPHVVTIAEGLGGKGAGFTTITFAAVGDSISLAAQNLHWVPTAAPYGVVIS